MDSRPLPRWGVGPLFVAASVGLSALGIAAHLLTDPAFAVGHTLRIALAVAGAVLIPLGLYLWVSAARCIDRYTAAGALMQAGPYAIVRNPIYAGILYVLSGILLLWGSVVLLPVPPLLYLLLRRLVRREEGLLQARFGAEYTAYAARVHAVLPWPGLARRIRAD